MGKALLALADGTVFEGSSFGSEGERIGELVFNPYSAPLGVPSNVLMSDV